MDKLKMLKNKHDNDLYFYENELQKAKDYFMIQDDVYFPDNFNGTIEQYKTYKKQLDEYEQELLQVENLEELANVLNKYTDIFNDGSEFYVKEI